MSDDFLNWDWKADIEAIRNKISQPLPECLECEFHTFGADASFFRFEGIDGEMIGAIENFYAQCPNNDSTWVGGAKVKNDGKVPIRLQYVHRLGDMDVVLCEGICPVGEGWQTIGLESV